MVWHKPFLSTYSDNYRYGSTLYVSSGYDTSSADAEKKYRNTLAKTPVRSDRGDLGMYSFVGSHIHGGVPAKGSENALPTPSVSKSSTSDLYAPLSFGYGRGYYNNLRADAQTTKSKTATKSSDLYTRNLSNEASAVTTTAAATSSSSYDLKTHSAKTTSSYDDAKKTITTTTTTERWVPLSSYLYGYPSFYYHYSADPHTTTHVSKTTDDLVCDYKNTISTSRKNTNIEALDLNISKQSMEKFDYNNWMEKCRDIQTHLDQVNRWVADAETKIKTDVVGARNKMQTELTEVTLVVEDTAKYNDELQKVIKRQARQITDLHSQYDDINRHLTDVSDTLEKSRVRCQALSGELTSVQTGLELAMRRK